MFAKLPFDCEVLKDLVMDLSKRADITYAPIVCLAEMLTPEVDQETLKEELRTYNSWRTESSPWRLTASLVISTPSGETYSTRRQPPATSGLPPWER